LVLRPGPLERLRLRLRPRGGEVAFSGRYARWADAQTRSTGWSEQQILERVADAARKVARGEAAFERDSVTFARPERPEALLRALASAAAGQTARALSVLDFGGSLGSSFFQSRRFLPGALDWRVVEQAAFVELGQREFAGEQLRFFSSVREAAAAGAPDLALASGVLHYLEDPYPLLDELQRAAPRYLLIDRTPFSAEPADWITLQRVPPSIYPASYPCRVFSWDGFMARLGAGWRTVETFPALDGWAREGATYFRFCGVLLERSR
jgi:putative methyltransferase (TIGR04325 family)